MISMTHDIISKRTRIEFREHLVGYTLHEIAMAFDAEDVSCDRQFKPDLQGQRRSLVEQYYRTIDFSDVKAARKVLRVYEAVLQRLEHEKSKFPDPKDHERAVAVLTQCLANDGFTYRDRKILPKGQAHLAALNAAVSHLDLPELQTQLQRLRDSDEQDPALAIGTAKELVETTCKTILNARGIAFDERGDDLLELVKATRTALRLMPEDVPSAAKGVETMRRLLGNLGNVAQGLAELRNLYGTGHGRAGSARGLAARHARLAVGLRGHISDVSPRDARGASPRGERCTSRPNALGKRLLAAAELRGL